ncbi:integrase [Streptomyces jumonjinensis]|uniref:integrase n=1 Tax=Streptomyces jumonjinensis TaxID=1945 RepID=UPI0037BD7C83
MNHGSTVPRPVGTGRQQLSAAARAALDQAVPEETRRGYAGDWARFEAWANLTGYPAMPCTAETLVEYTTVLTVVPRERTGEPYKPASIDRALAAIVVAHKTAGRTPPDQTAARAILKAYEKRLKETKDPRGRVRKASAAVPTVLRRMITHTDLTTPSGLRDRVALTNGFALAARSSEARLLDWEDAVQVETGLEWDLWRPKVNNDQPLGVPYGSYHSTCPVRALLEWGQWLTDHGRPLTGPILIRTDRHGNIVPPMTRHGEPIGDPSGRMTTKGIGQIVTRAAKRAGLTRRPDTILPDGDPRWTGHALRRGYAEASRQAKKDPLEAARHGGWVDGSKAFARYFDRAAIWDEELNPLFGIGL